MILVTIVFVIIIAAAVSKAVFMIRGNAEKDRYTSYLFLSSAVLLIISIIIRSIQIQFFAVTNTYESLIFYACAVCFILFVYEKQRKIPILQGIVFGGIITAAALLAVASSPIAPSSVQPPIPALQSGWLVLHVTFSFIGEAFFVVAFISSILYLTVKDETKKRNSDRITYTAVGLGYPVFTVGALIFGAIWAKYAWGSYWSWDPKETWALITWLVYTAYLHSRMVKKLRGKGSAILSIIGFLFTLFTFFGVNFLLSGLHSYG